MQETAANNSLVSYSVIGESYEGRDIGQATIRTGNPGGKQIIYLECGIHAREWVAPSTCIWIFDQVRYLFVVASVPVNTFNMLK